MDNYCSVSVLQHGTPNKECGDENPSLTVSDTFWLTFTHLDFSNNYRIRVSWYRPSSVYNFLVSSPPPLKYIDIKCRPPAAQDYMYPQTPPDNRQTNLWYLVMVVGQTIQAEEHSQADKRMDRWMDGCYQVYYLPATH